MDDERDARLGSLLREAAGRLAARESASPPSMDSIRARGTRPTVRFSPFPAFALTAALAAIALAPEAVSFMANRARLLDANRSLAAELLPERFPVLEPVAVLEAEDEMESLVNLVEELWVEP